MPLASTFLSLDATAWTALAAIIALSLGLWSIVGAPFIEWIRKPRLSFVWDKCFMHSELVGDAYFIRLPVTNASWVKPGNSVEVFLEQIEELHSNHPLQLPRYLPIRIKWTHGGALICDRIAPGTYRLLDLADLAFTINSETDFVDAVMTRLRNANPAHLSFNCEVESAQGRIALPVGTFRLSFLITSDRSINRQHATITLKQRHLEEPYDIAQHLTINSD